MNLGGEAGKGCGGDKSASWEGGDGGENGWTVDREVDGGGVVKLCADKDEDADIINKGRWLTERVLEMRRVVIVNFEPTQYG